jgi:putative ABC transport system ATP-binding protein
MADEKAGFGQRSQVGGLKGKMNDNKVVEIKNLVKSYGAKNFQTTVLKGIDLTIYKNDFIAIMGPSGSGKTTLLNILSTIDKPTQGMVTLDGHDVTHISNKELAKLRKDKIGFVFQDYNLLDTMTLQDNIALPLALDGVPAKRILEKTKELAAAFGLEAQLRQYPYQLSGGQKQRGAVCRALITEPEIIFADEPTGALDSKAGKDLLHCLHRVNESGQASILMVTHDPHCASYAKDVYLLSDGVMKCRISRGNDRKEFYSRIIDLQTSIGGDFA